jgi:hypothetical protein
LQEADQMTAFEALKNADFKPKIDPATGQLTVPSNRYHEARILLASQGLPKTGSTGLDALKDQSSMTTSQLMEQQLNAVTAERDSSTGMFIWEPGNTVNGYRTEVSNQVASNDFWFGNWADLLLGFWSGLDLLVDPYTGATSGTVRVVALQDVDVAVRHGESFARGNNTL